MPILGRRGETPLDVSSLGRSRRAGQSVRVAWNAVEWAAHCRTGLRCRVGMQEQDVRPNRAELDLVVLANPVEPGGRCRERDGIPELQPVFGAFVHADAVLGGDIAPFDASGGGRSWPDFTTIARLQFYFDIRLWSKDHRLKSP